VFTLLAVALILFVSYRSTPSLADSAFKTFRIDPLVADADIRRSAISPDGKYLALVQIKNDVQSLYLRQVENGNTAEIVPKIRGEFLGAAFSAKADQLYYSVNENATAEKKGVGKLYTISIPGGASKEVLSGIDSPPSVSPTADRLAFTRTLAEQQQTALIIANADGKDQRQVSVRSSEDGFVHSGVSWSPDGKRLAATISHDRESHQGAQVVVVDPDSGSQQILSHENWISAGQTLWLKDGSGIVTVAYGAQSPTLNDELWIVSYPGGKGRFITGGINGAYGISLNATSNSIAAVQSNRFACFLTASVDNLYKNTHVLTTISEECSMPFGADWTGDGKIVYSATEGGNADIFTISEDGTASGQLTSDASAEIQPKLSSDGRYLIFLSNRTGQMDVWRSDANGTNTLRLTTEGDVREPVLSPDGSAVYYLRQGSGAPSETLWRIPIDGGTPTQLTHALTRSPSISPDGRAIACYLSDPQTNNMVLALIDSASGTLMKRVSVPANDDIPFIEWAKDNDSLFVVLQRAKPFSLWRVPVNGKPPEMLREWENDAIFRLAISRDGKRVFYEVGNQLNSVVEFHTSD
jgi:TolB protein